MTPTSAYVPRRGDVVWLDFDPHVGHEQGGHRPAIVISPDDYNRTTGLAIVCPITSKAKGFAREVPVPPGLAVSGVVLCDHIRNVDWQGRGVTFAGVAPTPLLFAVVGQVLRAINN
jgi:mRNA interferase MazF